VDRVAWQLGDQAGETTIEKTRPDDFIAELTHIEGVLEGRDPSEIIQLHRGLDTMLVIAAAHHSAAAGRRVEIDYSAGYSPDALRVA
jgi:hypothetical protein